VECAQYREAASARLDGEAIGMSAAALAAHLSTCEDCAGWLERATTLTRSLRMGAAAVPDLTDAILSRTPMPRPRRARPEATVVLRAALGLAGAIQLVTSLPALAGDGMAMSMSTHAAHESAAWNLAVAVGFLAVAAAPRRVAGVLPVLATFVLILSVLSIPDLAGGHVTLGRLATHVGALLGVGAMAMLHRLQSPRTALPPDASTAAEDDEGRDADDSPPRGGLRGVA
jgi:predicted anti-sigma-YlaC factor YlaD